VHDTVSRFRYQSFSLQGFDAESLLGVIRDSRFEQRLLRGGSFRVFHQRLVLGECSLDSGRYSLPILAQGAFSGRHLAFGIMLDSSEPTFINGHAAETLDIQVHPPGGELHCRPTAGDWTWAALLVAPAAFVAAAERFLGAAPPIRLDRTSNVRPAPAPGRALRHAIESAFHVGACARGQSGAERGSIEVEQRLLEALIRALASADPQAAAGAPPRDGRWVRMVRRAEDFLRHHAHEPYGSAALCGYVGASERALQYAFHAAHGLSPRQWHMVMRLNLARRELIAGAPDEARVADVAARWGFYHFGRFSTRYRAFFGEAPAATLRRPRAGAQIDRSAERLATSRPPGRETRAAKPRPAAGRRA
jgi:AraC-like DNA-binding protein